MKQIYVFKKKEFAMLHDSNQYLMIRDVCHGKYVFRSVEKFYTGDRLIFFLRFDQAIRYLKHHPTGRYDHGDEITWVDYDDDYE
jgi:hypothetical protein